MSDEPATTVWGKRERWLLAPGPRRCERQQEIRLAERDLEALSHPSPPPLPDAFAVTARVAAPSSAAFVTGDFRVRIGAVTGASGAVLLGRFCHADLDARRTVPAKIASAW